MSLAGEKLKAANREVYDLMKKVSLQLDRGLNEENSDTTAVDRVRAMGSFSGTIKSFKLIMESDISGTGITVDLVQSDAAGNTHSILVSPLSLDGHVEGDMITGSLNTTAVDGILAVVIHLPANNSAKFFAEVTGEVIGD